MELLLRDSIEFIESQINYSFHNKFLLQQAFTRKSFTQEHEEYESNEVFEFLGDSELNSIVTKWIFDSFLKLPSSWSNELFYSPKDEAELTEIRKKYISKNFLASCIDRLGLARFLLVGKSDEHNNARNSPSVKEDLFEAIIGAIFIDLAARNDYSKEDKISNACKTMLQVGDYEEDYVSLLESWCEDWNFPEIDWRVQNIFTYNGTCFRCTVSIADEEFPIRETADGKTEFFAKMEAAKLAYKKCLSIERQLENEEMLEIIGSVDYETSVSQLNMLHQKGFFSKPDYNEIQKKDEDNNQYWRCECFIDTYKNCPEYNNHGIGESNSKKEAKKEASFDMLNYILSLK